MDIGHLLDGDGGVGGEGDDAFHEEAEGTAALQAVELPDVPLEDKRERDAEGNAVYFKSANDGSAPVAIRHPGEEYGRFDMSDFRKGSVELKKAPQKKKEFDAWTAADTKYHAGVTKAKAARKYHSEENLMLSCASSQKWRR